MGTRIMHGRTGIWLHFPGKIIYGLLQVLGTGSHLCNALSNRRYCGQSNAAFFIVIDLNDGATYPRRVPRTRPDNISSTKQFSIEASRLH